jgi:GT2 family glycosyltransferase
LLHDDGQPQVSCYPPITALSYWQNSSILYPFFERVRKLVLRFRPLTGDRECGWLMGSCVMVPRAVYEQVGGLEKSYFMYCEDADWCARIREAGWQVWFVPGLVMRHRQKGSSRRAAEFTFRRVYRSIVHYANRNLKGWARRRLLAAMMADMVLRLPVYTALACVKPARWARLGSVARLMRIVWSANPDLFHDPRPGSTS